MEVERINVESAPVNELSFRYGSADEALSAFGSNERRRRAESEGSVLIGSPIVGYRYDWHSVSLLVGDRSLRIYLANGVPEWAVGSQEQHSTIQDGGRVARECVLVWKRVGPCTWHRDGLLASRVGKSIELMSSGNVNILLYIRGMMILQFSPLMNRDTGEVFLRWGEID